MSAAVVKGVELQEQLEKSTVIYFQYKVNFHLGFLWNHLIGCQTEAAAQATPSGPATVSPNQPSADGCQSNGLKRCLMWGNMTAKAALAHLSDQSAAAHPADMWQRLAPPDLLSPDCLICVWVWTSEVGNRQEVRKQDGVLVPQLWNKKVTDEAKVFLFCFSSSKYTKEACHPSWSWNRKLHHCIEHSPRQCHRYQWNKVQKRKTMLKKQKTDR